MITKKYSDTWVSGKAGSIRSYVPNHKAAFRSRDRIGPIRRPDSIQDDRIFDFASH